MCQQYQLHGKTMTSENFTLQSMSQCRHQSAQHGIRPPLSLWGILIRESTSAQGQYDGIWKLVQHSQTIL